MGARRSMGWSLHARQGVIARGGCMGVVTGLDQPVFGVVLLVPGLTTGGDASGQVAAGVIVVVGAGVALEQVTHGRRQASRCARMISGAMIAGALAGGDIMMSQMLSVIQFTSNFADP